MLAFDELLPWKTEDNGVYGGAYTEIVRELARRSKLELEIRPCPLKRCLFMLEHGDADILIGLRQSPERLRFLHFLSTPYREHGADRVFYVQAGRTTIIRDYTDLAPLRIGVKLAAEYFERFDHDDSLHKEAVKDMETNFRKLALGRIDAILIPEDQGEALIADLHLEGQLEKARYRVSDIGQARSIAVSRKAVPAARLKLLETAMRDMAKDGMLVEIYKRYYYDLHNIPASAVQIK